MTKMTLEISYNTAGKYKQLWSFHFMHRGSHFLSFLHNYTRANIRSEPTAVLIQTYTCPVFSIGHFSCLYVYVSSYFHMMLLM